jgi:hypothetical protein
LVKRIVNLSPVFNSTFGMSFKSIVELLFA